LRRRGQRDVRFRRGQRLGRLKAKHYAADHS
jgi:hypothetical protein